MTTRTAPTRSVLTVILSFLALLASARGAGAQVAGVTPTSARQGETVTLTAGGLLPGDHVTVQFGGATRGEADVDEEGFAHITITIPSDFPVGTHPMDIVGVEGSMADVDFTVTEALQAPPPPEEPACDVGRATAQAAPESVRRGGDGHRSPAPAGAPVSA